MTRSLPVFAACRGACLAMLLLAGVAVAAPAASPEGAATNGATMNGAITNGAITNGATTNGDLALANLDGLIAQAAGEPGAVDLLLLRGQFLADHEVLDQVAALTELHDEGAAQLLRRAHARAAAHRFQEAGLDLDAAERAGAPPAAVRAQRASLQVALGRARDALPGLRAQAARRPGFGSHCALALAEAAVGDIEQADALYATALRELDTTSPFPAAAVWFARGLMWSEQAGDPRRGAAMYAQALREVPSYVPASLHLAELEAARGDTAGALARVERIVALSRDPESLALLGTLHRRTGAPARRRAATARSRRRAPASRTCCSATRWPSPTTPPSSTPAPAPTPSARCTGRASTCSHARRGAPTRWRSARRGRPGGSTRPAS